MTSAPYIEDPLELRQGHIQSPKRPDQTQLSHNGRIEEAIAPLGATNGMNQPFIAVEAHRFHGQATGLGHLADPQRWRLHTTTLQPQQPLQANQTAPVTI
jgi:hypothetical protein